MAVFLGLIASLTITTIIRGFVFKQMWSWFVIPAFGVQEISVPLSIGLMAIVGFVAPFESKNEDDKPLGEFLLEGNIKSVVTSVFCLLIGFVVHLFV